MYISERRSESVVWSVFSFRDRRHQDFVRGVCWVPGGSAVLTTVGWDHQVLHHSVSAPQSIMGNHINSNSFPFLFRHHQIMIHELHTQSQDQNSEYAENVFFNDRNGHECCSLLIFGQTNMFHCLIKFLSSVYLCSRIFLLHCFVVIFFLQG